MCLVIFLQIAVFSPALRAQEEGNGKSPGARRPSIEEWEQKRQRSISQELKRDGENRFRYARMLFTEAYYERARELWERFILLLPTHPRYREAKYHLALIAEKQGRLTDAMTAYEHIYQEEPGHKIAVRAYLQAGRLAVRLGNTVRARKIFKQITQEKKGSYFARMAQVELDAIGFDNTL